MSRTIDNLVMVDEPTETGRGGQGDIDTICHIEMHSMNMISKGKTELSSFKHYRAERERETWKHDSNLNKYKPKKEGSCKTRDILRSFLNVMPQNNWNKLTHILLTSWHQVPLDTSHNLITLFSLLFFYLFALISVPLLTQLTTSFVIDTHFWNDPRVLCIAWMRQQS